MSTKYKTMMSNVEKVLAEKPAITPTSGLLSPSKVAKKEPTTSPEATIAKYIAIIRKQRQELTK